MPEYSGNLHLYVPCTGSGQGKPFSAAMGIGLPWPDLSVCYCDAVLNRCSDIETRARRNCCTC